MSSDISTAELTALAHQFRLGLNMSACLRLPDVLLGLMPVVGSLSDTHGQKYEWIVGQILNCQMQHDWLGLADYLEYDLVELLAN